MKKRGFAKRIAALLFTLVFLISYTAPVVANAADSAHEASRVAVKKELSTLYGTETAEKLMQKMVAAGLMDSNGNLLQYAVHMDGRDYSVAEMRELLATPGVDLTRELSIAGETLPLKDLQSMLEIEDEIAEIAESYYGDSDVTPTEEHEESLQSLIQQLEEEGIEVSTEGAPGDAIGDTYASQNLRVTVTGGPGDGIAVTRGDTITYTVTLSESPKRPVTLEYFTLEGSARKDKHYVHKSETITFAANTNVLSQDVTITTKDVTLDRDDYANTRWQGEKVFIVQFKNLTNALFNNGETALAKTVRLAGNYTYDATPMKVNHASHTYSFVTYNGSVANNLDHVDLFKEGTTDCVVNQACLYDMGESTLQYSFMTELPEMVKGSGHPNHLYAIPELYKEDIVTRLRITATSKHDGTATDVTITVSDLYTHEKKVTGVENQPTELILDFRSTDEDDKLMTKYLMGEAQYAIMILRVILETPLVHSIYVGFEDIVPPALHASQAVTVPAGTYTAGDTIPITVTFTEPVAASNLIIPGTPEVSLAPVENPYTKAYQYTYLYTVQDIDSGPLKVKTPAATDLVGNALAAGTTVIPCADVTMAVPNKKAALSGVAITEPTTFTADATEGKMEAAIGSVHKTWLGDDIDEPGDPLKSIVGSVDGGATFFGLVPDDNGSKVTGTFTLEPALALRDMRVELYEKVGDTYSLILGSGRYADFSVPGAILIDDAADLDITYPTTWASGADYVIFDSAEDYTQLGYTVKKDTATYKAAGDFEWSIAPGGEDIAEIDQDGYIRPKGIAYGDFTVQLTAKNGPFDDYVITSNTLQMRAGANPMLRFKGNYVALKNSQMRLLWDSNIVYKNREENNTDTTFTVLLYKGNHTNLDNMPTNPDKTWTVENENETTIEAGVLAEVSVGGVPAYTVVVQTPNPSNTSETMKAICHIVVNEPPVTLHLVSKTPDYLLDNNRKIEITWDMGNFDTTNTGSTFEFAVYKGDTKLPGSEISYDGSNFIIADSINTTATATGGSYTFTPGPVPSGTLYEVYSVETRAKNPTDSGWSDSSLLFYVYDEDALDILVDGASAGASLTLNNLPDVKAAGSSSAIMNMYYADQLKLRKALSINYADYDWKLLYDKIAWQSSDSNVATINYKQGSMYENIQSFSYTGYPPNTEFALSGLMTGDTTITATHARTGMTQTVDVSVETLKDKLYLFQAYPKAVTTLSYTNGKNQNKTATTDANGVLALLEEDGIISNISMESTYNGGKYLGTVYKNNLLSGEKDSVMLAQYPINHVRLNEVATTTLYFKLPDGSPYTGKISYNGGVYKNGYYCKDAQLEPDANKTIDVLLGPGGRLELAWDTTKFWSAEGKDTPGATLQAGDNIQYVLLVYTDNNYYYPELIHLDANTPEKEKVAKTENVISLTRTTKAQRQTPFVADTKLDMTLMDGDTLTADGDALSLGIVAPSEVIPEINVRNIVMWWGLSAASANGYSAQLKDGVDHVPSAQGYESFKYPFSPVVFTKHELQLNKDTLWMESVNSGSATLSAYRSLYLSLHTPNNAVYKTFSLPYAVINAMGLESVMSSEEMKDSARSIRQSLTQKQTQTDVGSDPTISSGLNFLSSISLNTSVLKFQVAPTENPLVYKCLVELNIGKIPSVQEQKDGGEFEPVKPDLLGGLSPLPGFSDLKEIGNGTYKETTQKQYEEAKKNTKNGDKDILFTVNGYYQGEIRYNTQTRSWKCVLLTGGLTLGGGGGYHWNFNFSVGPAPITVTLGVGAAITIGGHTNVLYTDRQPPEDTDKWEDDSVKSVNDYLAKLRIYAYFDIFGGLGIDYSVLALKIGVFGNLMANFQNAWLVRNYMLDENERVYYGNQVQLSGTIGAKFVAQVLFISYEQVFGSYHYSKTWENVNWKYVNEYWKKHTGRNITSMSAEEALTVYTEATGGGNTQVISNTAKVESRDYLTMFDREWNPAGTSGGEMSLEELDDPNRAPGSLQTNAYPYANPQMLDDGSAFVYLSDQGEADVNMTRAAWALRETDNTYTDKKVIEDVGYGDSGLQVDGNGSYAAAVWVRQTARTNKQPNEEVTNDDIAAMMASSEIVVARYEGGSWTTKQLTDNALPDLAPVVATNDSKVFVAWRSVFSSDASNQLNFDTMDCIRYSVWDGTSWSAPETLYNGNNGSVMGIQASMLPDGTAAVAYTVDQSRSGQQNQYKIAYAVVDTTLPALSTGDIEKGENRVVKSLIVSPDDTVNENPQITTAKIAGVDHFVLGWYSQNEADTNSVSGDIQLRAFDKAGTLVNFPESISAISSYQGGSIQPNFEFVRTDGTKPLDDLSLIWAVTSQPITTPGSIDLSTASSSLKAVKLHEESGGRIYTSAIMDVAEMKVGTVVDAFTAYLADPTTRQVQALILASANSQYTETVKSDVPGVDTSVQIPIKESELHTATATYNHNLMVESVVPEYNELHKNGPLNVSFSLFNGGYEAIEKIEIAFDNQTATTYDNLDMLPGSSLDFNPVYQVPDPIVDVGYTVTATYASDTQTLTGSLYLTVQDLNLTEVKTLRASDGEREFSVVLQNLADTTLFGSGREVKIGLYEDANQERLLLDELITIKDGDDLQMIDECAYEWQGSFDVKNYVQNILKADEIPQDGIVLYLVGWIEENGKRVYEPLVDNNTQLLTIQNLESAAHGGDVSITLETLNEGGVTKVNLEVQNLKLAPKKNGNVALVLLDDKGNVLETKTLTQAGQSLLTFGSEAIVPREVAFSQKGASVQAVYFEETPGTQSHELQRVSMTGAASTYNGLQSGVRAYTHTATNLESTLVTAMAENKQDTVEIWQNGRALASGTGLAIGTVPLARGAQDGQTADNPIIIRVVPQTGAAVEYTFTVTNKRSDNLGGVVLNTSVTPVNGWVNQTIPGNVQVEATFSSRAGDNDNRYYKQLNDAAREEITGLAGAKAVVATLSGDGVYQVQAWAETKSSMKYEATPLTVRVDRTLPVISANVQLESTDLPLEGNRSMARAESASDTQMRVTVQVTDTVSGVASVKAITDNGDAYPLEATGKADEYSGLITKAYIGDLYLEATDMAGNVSRVLAGQVVVDGEQPITMARMDNMTDVSAELNGSAYFANARMFTSAYVQYKEATSDTWKELARFDTIEQAKQFLVTLEGLKAATNYQVRLMVQNAAGKEIPGMVLDFTTLSSKPAAPKVLTLTSTSVDLEAVPNALYRLFDGENWTAWGDASSFTGLTAGKEYTIEMHLQASDTTPKSMPATVGFTTYPWQIITYNANCSDDVTTPAPQQVSYSVAAGKPADLNRRIDHFFTGWYTSPDCKEAYDFSKPVTESMTLYAGWRANTIQKADYKVVDKANAAGWSNRVVRIYPANGYTAIWNGSKWASSLAVKEGKLNTVNFKLQKVDADGVLQTVELDDALTFKVDTTAPTGVITVGENAWRKFMNNITFGNFFHETYSATITGQDALSGVQTVEYWRSDTELPLATLLAGDGWQQGKSYDLKAGERLVLYARITDNAGNYCVISTGGLVVAGGDSASPGSSGGTAGTTGQATVLYDSTKPLIVTEYDYDGMWTNNEAVGIAVSLNDPDKLVDSVVYTIEGEEPVESESTNFVIGNLPDGEYTVTIEALGRNGDTLETATVLVKKDTVVPELTVAGLPQGTAEGEITLTVSAAPENISGILYQVSANGGDFVALDGNTYVVTENGRYTFRGTTGSGTVVDEIVEVTQFAAAPESTPADSSDTSVSTGQQDGSATNWPLIIVVIVVVVALAAVLAVVLVRRKRNNSTHSE